MAPSIPNAWPRYEIRFKHLSATYDIVIDNPKRVSSGIAEIRVDGKPLADALGRIRLEDDGSTHQIIVTMG